MSVFVSVACICVYFTWHKVCSLSALPIRLSNNTHYYWIPVVVNLTLSAGGNCRLRGRIFRPWPSANRVPHPRKSAYPPQPRKLASIRRPGASSPLSQNWDGAGQSGVGLVRVTCCPASSSGSVPQTGRRIPQAGHDMVWHAPCVTPRVTLVQALTMAPLTVLEAVVRGVPARA